VFKCIIVGSGSHTAPKKLAQDPPVLCGSGAALMSHTPNRTLKQQSPSFMDLSSSASTLPINPILSCREGTRRGRLRALRRDLLFVACWCHTQYLPQLGLNRPAARVQVNDGQESDTEAER
jgi:hypothetical protein